MVGMMLVLGAAATEESGRDDGIVKQPHQGSRVRTKQTVIHGLHLTGEIRG